MPELNLYRLHLRAGQCIGKHPERSQSYEGQEKKKGWRKCECPIQASGTLGGRFLRKATGKSDWINARAWAKFREDANSWDVTTEPIPVHPVKAADAKHVPATRDAVEEFLRPYKKGCINTWRSYRMALGKLVAWGEQLSDDMQPVAILVTDWNRRIVRDLRNSWDAKPATVARQMTIIRNFFWFCVESEWLDDNPGVIRAIRSRRAEDREDAQKHPFSDDEIDSRMMDACTAYKAASTNGRLKWRGEDLADFIQVGKHTGLRISDLSNFHISRLGADNQCKIRCTKNGNWVTHELPGWLGDRLRWRAEKFGPYIFGQSGSDDPAVHPRQWRQRLVALWKLCEIDGFKWEKRPTPHRFRHTFARILLQTPGVEVRDVAELLGDTEEMVRKHYKAWVPELQERLTLVMREAFKGSKPPEYLRPKLVA